MAFIGRAPPAKPEQIPESLPLYSRLSSLITAIAEAWLHRLFRSLPHNLSYRATDVVRFKNLAVELRRT